MAKIQDCPGFEPFGADVKAARKQMRLSRQKVAKEVGHFRETGAKAM